MTRDQLLAWARDLRPYDHLAYAGKAITIKDVKLAVAAPPIVYAVVWAAGWEDGVRGVFTTRERAQAWLDEYLAGWDEPYRARVQAKHRILEWPLDEPERMPSIDWHIEGEGSDEP